VGTFDKIGRQVTILPGVFRYPRCSSNSPLVPELKAQLHRSRERVFGWDVKITGGKGPTPSHRKFEETKNKYMYRTIYTGNLSSLSYHLFDFKLIQKAQTLKPFQRKNSSQSDQFMVKLRWRWFCPNELSSQATWQIHPYFMFQVENSRGCFYWCQETL